MQLVLNTGTDIEGNMQKDLVHLVKVDWIVIVVLWS